MEKVVLSGMRPTGKLHLGNYFGALKNWVNLQKDYKCYFFIADWHALTTGYEETSEFKESINQMVLDWLSAGIDPEKSTIFLQSRILEHAELHLLLSMITPLSWLERCPTYKEQLAQMPDKNITTYGFLGYPCLMASDILIYNADYVPVGEDQLPHLELAREIARRFNFLYGNVLTEPQPKLTKEMSMPGTDGRKMHKSYGNTIALSDSPEEIRKKVSMIVTDPSRIRRDDPGHPDVCTAFEFYKIFNYPQIQEVEQQCKGGEIGCVQCKNRLAKIIESELSPIYEKRQLLEKKSGIVEDIVNKGSKEAKRVAGETMIKVRKAMKIDY